MMLSIFTPSYNRADSLPHLYRSLLAQSCFDFEWLIVDDGSTDTTAEVAKTFLQETRFPVRYLQKENGGKHTAHNLALQEARGEWFLCVDSDDLLAPTAVADLLDAIQPGINGIVSYKTDFSGKYLCSEFPPDLKTEKFYRLSMVHGCTGEYTLAFSTAFAKKFPFPVFEGERFLGESIIYDQMDTQGDMVLLPKVITLCEYQSDGLSNHYYSLMKKNPCGFCLYFLQRIDLQQNFFQRMICAGKYHCFRLICGNRTLRYTGKHRISVALAAPLGLLFRIYYKLFRNI